MKHYPFFLAILFLGFNGATCKKSPEPTPVPIPPVEPPVVVIKPQTDPAIASTIGFFLNDWQPKNYSLPGSYKETAPPSGAVATISIDRSEVMTKIPVTNAGANSNLWMGQQVTEAPLMQYLTDLNPKVIRGPAGSVSDIYFWNMPVNRPPADVPKAIVLEDGTLKEEYFWSGQNQESWTFSLDNYYRMLAQTGSQGLLTVNYGYARYGLSADPVAAAAHLAADWVRYDNGRTKYWEVGNENYGGWEAGYRINTATNKDGQPQIITGALYGKHFKVFADSMRKAAAEIGKTIYIGAVVAEALPQSWESDTRRNWNAGLFANAQNSPDYYVAHNYFTGYKTNDNALSILNTAKNVTATMMSYLKQSIQHAGLTQKPISLSEWNIFAEGQMQQVSNVNGLFGLMVVGEALKNNYGLTARWDIGNGWENGNDHGMFNLGDEPGGVPKWNPRPSFYYLYFLQKTLGDRLLVSGSTHADLVSYASSFTSGETAVAIVNTSAQNRDVEIKITNFKMGNRYYWYELKGGTENGEFSRKVFVNGSGPAGISGGPLNYASIQPHSAATANGIRVTVPLRGAVMLVVSKG